MWCKNCIRHESISVAVAIFCWGILVTFCNRCTYLMSFLLDLVKNLIIIVANLWLQIVAKLYFELFKAEFSIASSSFLSFNFHHSINYSNSSHLNLNSLHKSMPHQFSGTMHIIMSAFFIVPLCDLQYIWNSFFVRSKLLYNVQIVSHKELLYFSKRYTLRSGVACNAYF